jgi:hypothetical protein
MLVLQRMKKFIFLFLFLPFISLAQERIILKGNVFDGITFFPIADANIYNFSSKKYSFTDKEGNFEIFVHKGDTIIVSKPIYKQILVEITQEIIENRFFDVNMYYKAIILKEVNVFALPATYDAFKKEFLSVDLSDFYKRLEGIGLTQQDINNLKGNKANLLDLIPGEAGKAIAHPISYLYDKFSKKAKMDRLYREMIENQEEVDNLPLKYNREIVTSLTGLEGEDLLDFMTFCKFSYYDLVRWSPEYIVVQIKNKFGDYEFYKALEDN